MKSVIIYTDGGCSPNPGLGGWGAILISPEHKRSKEISGFEHDSTNNRMELTAAIKALEALKFPCSIELHTDSQYLQKAFCNKWIENWQKNNWKTKKKTDVANRDLWEILVQLSKTHSITWNWVKGHADNKYNNRCDELVLQARSRAKRAAG